MHTRWWVLTGGEGNGEGGGTGSGKALSGSREGGDEDVGETVFLAGGEGGGDDGSVHDGKQRAWEAFKHLGIRSESVLGGTSAKSCAAALK